MQIADHHGQHPSMTCFSEMKSTFSKQKIQPGATENATGGHSCLLPFDFTINPSCAEVSLTLHPRR